MAEIISLEKKRNRFYALKEHAEQSRLWSSKARFNIVHSGRRSGKTEITGKRKIVLNALWGSDYSDPRFFCGAPTRDQAKRIYWNDLKAMVPKEALAGPPSETALIIPLINGAEIHVLGMDKPERIEGSPWDGGVLDEYGNMKKETWPEHVRPALADRNGWCDFIGVPEGRNHYWELKEEATRRKNRALKLGEKVIWDVFWWKSSDILPKEEIEQAKEDLDELTYQQEYEGSFINFSGRAYYGFVTDVNVGPLKYYPSQPLLLMFDFNVSPGVASIGQEQYLPAPAKRFGTGIISEVYIPRNSNTLKICDKIIERFGDHEGEIVCYGDSTGGAKGTAKIRGSDWELIKQKLTKHFGIKRVRFRVPKANPRERDRVASVNSRLLNYRGEVNMMIDPNCRYTIRDFEGVKYSDDGTGAIDKSDIELTHISDGIGYYIWREFPLKKTYYPSTETIYVK